MKNSESLTPAVFYILLALAKDDMHGYGIMKQVSEDSEGRINMGPGTLYGSIQRMLQDKLIEEKEPEEREERRKYYRITNSGKKTLAAEIERYNSVVKLARGLKLLLENS